MQIEVMQHYGLAKPFKLADYLETDHAKQLLKQIKDALLEGRLIAVCGIVGSGKTILLRHLQAELNTAGKMIVSKSLSIEKQRVTIGTLMAALFYDLSADRQKVKIPPHEKRERDLCELVKKSKKPVALFVDEAQDLSSTTLSDLKRLIELVAGGGGLLSVVLVGKPKLKYALGKSTMEEIGYRTDSFDFEGVAGIQRQYIDWLLSNCAEPTEKTDDILTEEAIQLLATKLRTPLQIQWHLARALLAGYEAGEKPVSATVVDAVLSKQLDDLEPTLKRFGFSVRDLAAQFDAKPSEIRALFDNQLDASRAADLRNRMLMAGLPI